MFEWAAPLRRTSIRFRYAAPRRVSLVASFSRSAQLGDFYRNQVEPRDVFEILHIGTE